MFCWHKWEKWSEIKYEQWEKRTTLAGITVEDPRQYLRQIQDRICKKCGKYQKRYIN